MGLFLGREREGTAWSVNRNSVVVAARKSNGQEADVYVLVFSEPQTG